MQYSDVPKLHKLRDEYIQKYNENHCNFILWDSQDINTPPSLWYRIMGAPYKKYGLDKNITYSISHIDKSCNARANTFNPDYESKLKRDIDAIIYENENRKWTESKTRAITLQRTDAILGGLNNVSFNEYVYIINNVHLHPGIYGYRKRRSNFYLRIIEHIHYKIMCILNEKF